MFTLGLLAIALQQAACDPDDDASSGPEDAAANLDASDDVAVQTDGLPLDVNAADVRSGDARADVNAVDSRLPDAAPDAEEGDGGLSVGYEPAGFLQGNKPNSFVQVGTGARGGCGLRVDGTVRCWGGNDLGESEPPTVPFSRIATGGRWSCGLRVGSNELTCWGASAHFFAPAGQFARFVMGDDPQQSFACGLRPNGQVLCWGQMQGETPTGLFTELGAGTQDVCGIKKADRSLVCWGHGLSLQEEVPSGEFLQVTVGASHACALKTDSSLTCWGRSETGAMVQSAPTGQGFSEVSAGPSHTCAIRNKAIVCWGANVEGQSDAPAGDFVRVSSGPRHTCAIKSDGELRCWGQIKFPVDEYASISADRSGGVCGVRLDGRASCWGEMEAGRAPPPGNFKEVAFSDPDCGILTDGTLTCWNRQIGGDIVPEPFEGTFKKVSTFLNDGCAIRTDGTLKCWSRFFNDRIQPPSGVFVDVSVARAFNNTADACAVREGGTIECWGDPSRQLSQVATPVGNFKQVSVSSAGGACAVAEGGAVQCWAGAPTQPDKTMLSVSAAQHYFCGITTGGEAVCWSALPRAPRGDLPPSLVKFRQLDGSDPNYTCGIDTKNRAWCWGNFVLRPLDE